MLHCIILTLGIAARWNNV